jgi:hypothetical protein
MSRQNLLAGLKKSLVVSFFLLLSLFTSTKSFSQVNYTINYSTSGLSTSNCNVFNVSGGVSVGGYAHDAVIGGASFDGTGINLKTIYSDQVDPNGNETIVNQGTDYAIQFPFQSGYVYQIQLFADQSGNYGPLYPSLWVNIASSLPATSNTCGAANNAQIIESLGSGLVSSTSYTTYTFGGFTAPAGSNYFLIGAIPDVSGRTTSSQGQINIEKIIITATPASGACPFGAPTGLGTTNNTQTLTWNAVPSAPSYSISITDTHNGTNTTVTEESLTNSYNYCAKAAGDNVSFTVQAVCTGGFGGAVSAPYSFVAANLAPANLAYNTTTNVLSWTAVPGATGYTVQITDETAGTGPVTFAVTGTQCSANALNLIADHNYQVSVSATTTCYTGLYSSTITFTAPCLYSTIGTTEQSGNYSPVWVFYEQVNTATSYSIRFTNVGTGIATTQSGLPYYNSGYQFAIGPGTYQVAIQTVNALCMSSWETYGTDVTVVATPACTPAPSFAAVETAGTNIIVYWNNTSGATSYNLKFVNVTTGGTKTVSNLPWSGSGYTYAAIAGDTYQVFIESNCSAGNSGWVEYSSNITVEATVRSLVAGQNNAFNNGLTDPSKFRIFPVPASGVVNLVHNADGNGNGDLSVINTLGSVLMVKQVGIAAGQNNYSLDVSKLSSGVYFIKLFNGKAVFLQKLIIQR